MKAPIRLYLLALLTLWPASAWPQHHRHGPVPCRDTGLACATTATPTFGPDGKLWLVWSADGRVTVGQSNDLGHTFERVVGVNHEPERIDTGPDARPKIAVDKNNRAVVAYAVFQDDRYNGRVMVSHSLDGGATFTTPRPITEDANSQRFETLAFDPDDNLFAAWLDKRHAAAARRTEKPYAGAALAYSWSSDAGESFLPAHIARDNACECCRLGVGFVDAHRPAVVFRNIFENSTRDHALLVFDGFDSPGRLQRISVDDWQIDACPHQGPAIAVSKTGAIHTAWFTAGKVRQGLFYARSLDAGAHFTAPLPVGDPTRRPARPYLLASGDKVRLVWKEFDGETTAVKLMTSSDEGNSWSSPEEVANTGDSSDHPLIVSDGRRTFLSWLTHAEGLRLIPLGL